MQRIWDTRTVGTPRAAAQALNNAIAGPTPLKAALTRYVDNGSGRDDLLDELVREIRRIRHVQIASVSHPNAAGAASYAANALARLQQHHTLSAEITQLERPGVQAVAPLPGQPETLDQKLTRYRLRGNGSLHAVAHHLDVDSIAVRVMTAPNSDPNFFADMTLYLTTVRATGDPGPTHQYLLNMLYTDANILGKWWVFKLYNQFEPGKTNRLTIDTNGRLRLDEVVSCSIGIGPDRLDGRQARQRYGKFWRPAQVRLEINGVEVVVMDTPGRAFGFNTSIDLQYPDPAPNVALPKIAPIRIANVREIRRSPSRVPAP